MTSMMRPVPNPKHIMDVDRHPVPNARNRLRFYIGGQKSPGPQGRPDATYNVNLDDQISHDQQCRRISSPNAKYAVHVLMLAPPRASVEMHSYAAAAHYSLDGVASGLPVTKYRKRASRSRCNDT